MRKGGKGGRNSIVWTSRSYCVLFVAELKKVYGKGDKTQKQKKRNFSMGHTLAKVQMLQTTTPIADMTTVTPIMMMRFTWSSSVILVVIGLGALLVCALVWRVGCGSFGCACQHHCRGCSRGTGWAGRCDGIDVAPHGRRSVLSAVGVAVKALLRHDPSRRRLLRGMAAVVLAGWSVRGCLAFIRFQLVRLRASHNVRP